MGSLTQATKETDRQTDKEKKGKGSSAEVVSHEGFFLKGEFYSGVTLNTT